MIITIELLQAVDVSDGTTGSEARQELLVDLFEKEGIALVRLARIFTDDRNAAEDLVQEAFIRLYRSTDRIEDRGKTAAYLRSILLNLCRDHNRRGLMSLRHQHAAEPATVSAEPDDLVLQNESQAEVVDALRELSLRQRECLVLRFYLDLSEREIAQTLGISANSVKTHCRRGLSTLRSSLGEAS